MSGGGETAKEAPASRLGSMGIWGIVFGFVFLALVLSVALQLSRGYYDARYVDVERTTLHDEGDGSRLSLVLRFAPPGGQVAHEVRAPTGEETMYTVVVDLTAEGERAKAREDQSRTLEIDLPRVERVRVLDRRFARDEVVVVERSTPPGDGS